MQTSSCEERTQYAAFADVEVEAAREILAALEQASVLDPGAQPVPEAEIASSVYHCRRSK